MDLYTKITFLSILLCYLLLTIQHQEVIKRIMRQGVGVFIMLHSCSLGNFFPIGHYTFMIASNNNLL